MPTEVQFHRFVKIICTLEPGDIVFLKGFGKELDDKDWEVEEIKSNIGKSESGFLVKLKGYGRYLDSNWMNKRPQQKLKM